MRFLLNRDTCIAWILNKKLVHGRFAQHQNDLFVAAPTVMGLAVWLLRPRVPIRYHVGYRALMQAIQVVNLDRNLAERAAVIGSPSSRSAVRLAPIDLMVIATALEGSFTLVTHDTQRYAQIPGLVLADWMVP